MTFIRDIQSSPATGDLPAASAWRGRYRNSATSKWIDSSMSTAFKRPISNRKGRRVLGLVGQVRGAVLHLGDPGLGVALRVPVLVGKPLTLALAVDADEIFRHRLANDASEAEYPMRLRKSTRDKRIGVGMGKVKARATRYDPSFLDTTA